MLEMKKISLFFVISLVKASVLGQFCYPGERFAWDCNACTCLDGKNTHCTRAACPNNDNILYYPKLNLIVKKKCKPSKKKFEYCNSCVCNDDGESYRCTNHVCEKDLWNSNGTLELKEASSVVPVEDHQRFVRSATDNICIPKSQFKEYCNTCVCSNDGLSKICTQLKCDENRTNKDSSAKPVQEQREQNSVKEQKLICKPNSQFKEDCNICICSKDGLQKACTMIICNKNKERK